MKLLRTKESPQSGKINLFLEMQPINTAILSFGMSGWVFHAPFIAANPGFKFHSVWERSKNLAQEKYPGVKTCRTLDEILSDKGVELVVVNTPNYTHFEFAKKALEAGMHVIVEKPFTVTVNEAEKLIELAEKQKRILSVYHNRRYDSDYRAIKKIVDDGTLGEIVEAEFHYDRYKEDLSPKLHKEKPGPGTGALYDLGSHLIDQALQLFGFPEALFADIRIVRKVSQVDDYFDLLLYYSNRRVRLKSSYLVREPLPAYILHGTKGSFIKPKTDVQETDLLQNKIPGSADWGKEPASEKGLLHAEVNGKLIKEFLPSEQGNYMNFYDGIYKAIRENAQPPVLPSEALNVIRIINKAFQSNEEKKVIEL
jgi:scyllo-inositol 2-dehydrogenase (NADP+)